MAVWLSWRACAGFGYSLHSGAQIAVSGDSAKDALDAVAAREHSAINTECSYLTDCVG